jgi:hypothetical protein
MKIVAHVWGCSIHPVERWWGSDPVFLEAGVRVAAELTGYQAGSGV